MCAGVRVCWCVCHSLRGTSSILQAKSKTCRALQNLLPARLINLRYLSVRGREQDKLSDKLADDIYYIYIYKVCVCVSVQHESLVCLSELVRPSKVFKFSFAFASN